MILHIGRWEIVFYRDREMQSLFISDPIEVASPGYWKLQTGVYIAAMRDARRRALRMKNDDFDYDKWNRNYKIALDWAGIRDVSRFRDTVFEEVHKNREWLGLEMTKEMCHLPRPFLSGTAYLRHFSETNDRSEGGTLDDRSLIRARITHPFDLTRQTIGILTFPKARMPSEKLTIPVFLKVGEGIEQTSKLRRDMAVHSRLLEMKQDTYSPCFYGYYHTSYLEQARGSGPWGVLLLENIRGRSVLDLLASKHIKTTISDSQTQGFEMALKNIHDAGFILPNLSAKHLMIQQATKKVFIVGFEDARRWTNESERKANMHDLRRLFTKPKARKAEDGDVPLVKVEGGSEESGGLQSGNGKKVKVNRADVSPAKADRPKKALPGRVERLGG